MVIGVSTGGPRTLEDVLPQLPADFPWPVVVAQHMPAAFTGSFAARLDKICALHVVEVCSALPLKRGQIYIGRGNADVIIDTRLGRAIVNSVGEDSEFLWHPSVERLVRSAMRAMDARCIVAVQLTGMGNDGAEAMTALQASRRPHDRRARIDRDRQRHAGRTDSSRRRPGGSPVPQNRRSTDRLDHVRPMPLIRSSAPVVEDPSSAERAWDGTSLLDDIENADVEVGRAAIRVAFRLGDAEILAQRLETEDDAALREAILTNLVRIGGVEAARPLIGLLSSDDARLRNAVIEALQTMDDSVAPEIERLLDDDNPDLRIYAVNVLASLRSPRAPDIALRVIATDPHVNVCAAAIDVLAEVGRPEMVDELRAVADRFPDRPFLAFAARAAIKRIG